MMRPAVPLAAHIVQVDAELPGPRAHGRRGDRPAAARVPAWRGFDAARGADAGHGGSALRRRVPPTSRWCGLAAGAAAAGAAAGSSGLQLDADQLRADRHRLADLAAQRQHAPGHRRRDLDGGLVGHHVGQHLVFGDRVAGLDMPGDEFDLGDALAEVGHLDDVDRHDSIARFSAAATRAGPGK